MRFDFLSGSNKYLLFWVLDFESRTSCKVYTLYHWKLPASKYLILLFISHSYFFSTFQKTALKNCIGFRPQRSQSVLARLTSFSFSFAGSFSSFGPYDISFGLCLQSCSEVSCRLMAISIQRCQHRRCVSGRLFSVSRIQLSITTTFNPALPFCLMNFIPFNNQLKWVTQLFLEHMHMCVRWSAGNTCSPLMSVAVFSLPLVLCFAQVALQRLFLT